MNFLNRITKILCLGLVLVLIPLLANNAHAHLFAPSLLKIVETNEDSYQVVWKTPTKTASNTPLQPLWPSSCMKINESPTLQEGTGIISSWTLRCDKPGDTGLVGKTLGISGLAQNQASAMIILNLRDGRQYQRVLNTDNSEFLIPPEPSHTSVITQYPILGAEHIWAGPDHLMFVFGLLLLVGGGARLLWTITAFTAGHSITLAIVTLGLFVTMLLIFLP